MKRIQILEIIQTGNIAGAVGGAETVLFNLMQHLNQDRFSVRALVVGQGGLDEKLRQHHFPVETFCFNRSYNWSLISRIRRIIAEHRIDIVHSHLSRMNTYGFAAAFLSRAKNVMTVHGTTEFSGFLGRLYYAVGGNLSGRVVAVSTGLADEFSARTKVRRRNITVIPNGIDVARFGAPVDREAVRRRFGLPDDARIILGVGNIRGIKGYDYLVDAFARIAARDTRLVLVIAGVDMFDTLVGLKEHARQSGFGDRIHFPGFVPDIETLYAAADLFALSSVTEGFSLTTVEAMASRLPVVSTDCLGPREIITDGIDGVIVPGRDPERFGEAMLELIEDGARCQAMGQVARDKVEGSFSITGSVAQFEALFMSLVGQRPE